MLLNVDGKFRETVREEKEWTRQTFDAFRENHGQDVPHRGLQAKLLGHFNLHSKLLLKIGFSERAYYREKSQFLLASNAHLVGNPEFWDNNLEDAIDATINLKEEVVEILRTTVKNIAIEGALREHCEITLGYLELIARGTDRDESELEQEFIQDIDAINDESARKFYPSELQNLGLPALLQSLEEKQEQGFIPVKDGGDADSSEYHQLIAEVLVLLLNIIAAACVMENLFNTDFGKKIAHSNAFLEGVTEFDRKPVSLEGNFVYEYLASSKWLRTIVGLVGYYVVNMITSTNIPKMGLYITVAQLFSSILTDLLCVLQGIVNNLLGTAGLMTCSSSVTVDALMDIFNSKFVQVTEMIAQNVNPFSKTGSSFTRAYNGKEVMNVHLHLFKLANLSPSEYVGDYAYFFQGLDMFVEYGCMGNLMVAKAALIHLLTTSYGAAVMADQNPYELLTFSLVLGLVATIASESLKSEPPKSSDKVSRAYSHSRRVLHAFLNRIGTVAWGRGFTRSSTVREISIFSAAGSLNGMAYQASSRNYIATHYSSKFNALLDFFCKTTAQTSLMLSAWLFLGWIALHAPDLAHIRPLIDASEQACPALVQIALGKSLHGGVMYLTRRFHWSNILTLGSNGRASLLIEGVRTAHRMDRNLKKEFEDFGKGEREKKDTKDMHLLPLPAPHSSSKPATSRTVTFAYDDKTHVVVFPANLNQDFDRICYMRDILLHLFLGRTAPLTQLATPEAMQYLLPKIVLGSNGQIKISQKAVEKPPPFDSALLPLTVTVESDSMEELMQKINYNPEKVKTILLTL